MREYERRFDEKPPGQAVSSEKRITMDYMENHFLKEILSTVSVSGRISQMQEVVKRYMEPVCDEIREDEIGDMVCVLNPEGSTRILAAAHADEIGLAVTCIGEDGRLHAVDRGGIIPKSYLGHQVQIMTRNGICHGCVAAARPLWEEKDLKVSALVIDIGAESREEAGKMVSVGDTITFDSHIRSLAGGRFTARALDDRLGVFIIMEALKYARELECKNGIYCAATAGEETTKNGAHWTAQRVEPDLAVVVDVTYATDYKGSDPAESGDVRLGKGPVLLRSPIVSDSLNDKLEACAKKAGIPIQWEAAGRLSFTDADRIHFAGRGIPVVLVSIPLRYMHTPAEVADGRDVEACIRLLGTFFAEASI